MVCIYLKADEITRVWHFVAQSSEYETTVGMKQEQKG